MFILCTDSQRDLQEQLLNAQNMGEQFSKKNNNKNKVLNFGGMSPIRRRTILLNSVTVQV
jgi:hypothetical protein